MFLFHLYRNIEGRFWGHPVTSSMTSSAWKLLFWHNLGRSFQIWSQNEAVFNISKFSKWPPFWDRNKLLTGSNTGSWIYQPDNHCHFRYFELLIEPIADILTEIYQFHNLTYCMSWWRHRWRHECMNITCTIIHPQLFTCKILFVWHQSFIAKSSGQISWQTETDRHEHTSKHTGWKHYHLANAGDIKAELFYD